MSLQTKFKHGDRVIVKSGFYRGMAGKVTNYKVLRFFWTVKVEYEITTDTGNKQIQLEEDQIELVGHK